MSEGSDSEKPFSPMSWIRDVRVTPLTLTVLLGALVAIWALFQFTDLWYVLFP